VTRPPDSSEEQRAEEIAAEHAALLRRYPAAWAQMVREWRATGEGDRCWLQYVASYLFRSGGVRWAVDLAFIPKVFPDDVMPDLAQDLEGLSFVLLTHQHGDHFCARTMRALAPLPVRWVVPDYLVEAAIQKGGLARERIVVPQPLDPFEMDGIVITAFDSLHWDAPQPGREAEQRPGVPATGYLIETGSTRLLLPGDVRDYDARKLPEFGPVDWVIAHLWLGRSQALLARPPLLEGFCQFVLDLAPASILLTHLKEVSRDPGSYWTADHGALAVARWREMAPEVRVVVPEIGDAVAL